MSDWENPSNTCYDYGQPWPQNLNQSYQHQPAFLLQGQNGTIDSSPPPVTYELQLEDGSADASGSRFPSIMEHLQNLCTNIENTQAFLKNQISYLTPEINNNGLAIQQLDDVTNSFQTSCDALHDTFKRIHSRLTVDSQSDEEGGQSEPEPFSPASTIQDVTSPGSPSTIQTYQDQCELLEARAKTLQLELDLIIAQDRILTLSQQIARAQPPLQKFVTDMALLCSNLHEFRGRICEKLKEWQTSRDMLVTELNDIQAVYRRIFATNENCRNQISQLMTHLHSHLHIGIPPDVIELQNKFASIRLDLISNSLVIEKLPNRNLKIGINFHTIVRCLVEKKEISLGNLRAVVINEEQMRRLNEITRNCSLVQFEHASAGCSPATPSEDGRRQSTRGTNVARAVRKMKQKMVKATATHGRESHVSLAIIDQWGRTHLHNVEPAYPDFLVSNEVGWVPGDDLTAAFEKAKIAEKLKRNKKNDSTVLEEKVFMIFHTKVVETVNGYPTELFVWASTPKSCRITTSTLQDAQTMADILFSDACDMIEPSGSTQNQHGGKTVPWTKLCPVLRDWLRESTKCEIGPELINSVRIKLLSYPTADGKNPGPRTIPRGHIAYNQFCKTKLPGKEDITFWGWLFAIPKFITEHVAGPFADGKISFTTRIDAEKKLERATVGNFLIRFSDTVEPGVVIGFVTKKGKVQFFVPLHGGHLKSFSLATYITQCEDLKFLLPNIPKDSEDGFQKYIDKDEPKKGYAKMLAIFSRMKVKDDAKSSAALLSMNLQPSTSASPRPSPRPTETSNSTWRNSEPSASVYQPITSSQAALSSASTVGMAQNTSMRSTPNYLSASALAPRMAFQNTNTIQAEAPRSSVNANMRNSLLSTTTSVNTAYDCSRNIVGDTNGMPAAPLNILPPQSMEMELDFDEILGLRDETDARRSSTEKQNLNTTEVLGVGLANPSQPWNYPSQIIMDGSLDYAVL